MQARAAWNTSSGSVRFAPEQRTSYAAAPPRWETEAGQVGVVAGQSRVVPHEDIPEFVGCSPVRAPLRAPCRAPVTHVIAATDDQILARDADPDIAHVVEDMRNRTMSGGRAQAPRGIWPRDGGSALGRECRFDPLDVLGAVAPPIVFVHRLRDLELSGDPPDAVDRNPHLHGDLFGREVALGNRHGRSSIVDVDYAASECLAASVPDAKLQVNCVREKVQST